MFPDFGHKKTQFPPNTYQNNGQTQFKLCMYISYLEIHIKKVMIKYSFF